jgi:actin-related protein
MNCPLNHSLNLESRKSFTFEYLLAFQVLFKKLKIKAVFVPRHHHILSLFTSRRTTGVVLDCRHGVTVSVRIYEGSAVSNAIVCVELAGNDITSCLMQELAQRGLSFTTFGTFSRVITVC